jgi:transposase
LAAIFFWFADRGPGASYFPAGRYELEVKAHCPNAAIVFDLFHVIAKYGREVIDRVRVDRAN